MAFENQFKDDTTFRGYFKGFWTNLSQSKAERAEFKQNIQPLFKIKRAILEVTQIDAKSIVVSKPKKSVSIADGHTLKFVAQMISKTNITWADKVTPEVRARYLALIS